MDIAGSIELVDADVHDHAMDLFVVEGFCHHRP